MNDSRDLPPPGDPSESAPGPPAAAERQAPLDAEAVRLGRFLPLGMALGAAAGLLAGLVTHRFGIWVPVGITLGILLAGTLPVFLHRR
jgi:hypothetical protein